MLALIGIDRSTSPTSRKNQAGYNLIQMAIAMLVLGVLSVPFLNIHSLSEKSKVTETTTQNMDYVLDALQEYKRNFGIYPCPAPMKILRFNSAYGHEVDFNDPSGKACRDTAIEAIAPGTCGPAGAHSVCIEQSIRTTLPNRRVIVGAIPFRLLQIDESRTVDGYGSKILYAVTESLTDQQTFNLANGAIAIRDGAVPPNSLITPDGGAAFAIVAPGQNKVGGYTLYGGLQASCSGPGKDVGNCRIGFETGTSLSTDSIFYALPLSTAAGANYFDDSINYFVNQTDPLWRRTLANPENIKALVFSSNSVGVGTALPFSSSSLDVDSSGGLESIRVQGVGIEPAKILTDKICDVSGTYCFDTEKIASPNPAVAFHCPPGQYMTGIENANPICQAFANSAIVCTDPSKPILIGIDNSSTPPTPICTSLPASGCSATTKDECSSGDVSLPLTPAGGITGWIPAVGSSCRSVQYACSSGGTYWGSSPYDTQGRCLWTPGALVSQSCGNACAFGYSGTFCYTTRQPTTGCLDPDVTTSNSATACTCIGANIPETDNCSTVLGPNYSGTATRNKIATPPTCAVTYTPWDTSACTCTAPPTTTSVVSCSSCPAGFTHPAGSNITTTYTLNPVTCSYITPGTTVTNCSCVCDTTPKTVYQTHTCADPACERPDTPDVYTITIDAATCTPNAPVLTTPGTCVAKSFHWQILSTNGAPVSSYPADHVFSTDACTCAEQSTISGVCFIHGDSSKQPYKCSCQE